MAKKKRKVKLTNTKSFKALTYGIWENNAIFRMMLGICSTLAVTNRVTNSIAMGLGVIFVTAISSTVVSCVKDFIPRRVRMAVYTIIIATFVIVVDQFLQAYFPVISEQMGPYVGLIITNCIIMGRCEAYAATHNPWLSFLDGIGSGAGYAISLLFIAVIREAFGFGTILGYQVMGASWNPWVVMVLPPGAFLILGTFIWILRTIQGVDESTC